VHAEAASGAAARPVARGNEEWSEDLMSSDEDANTVGNESVTESHAGNPENVGKSATRSGEAVVQHEGKEAGRHEDDPQGASERPVGHSTARDSTGIDPQEPIDPESPNLQPA